MTISGRDGLINALANNSSRLVIDKASISNAAAQQFHSLWRASGHPGPGAIPTAAAVCDNTMVGAFQWTQQSAPNQSYAGWAALACSNAAMTIELHDRLMHLGGLVGNVTTLQTAGLDLNANLATANLDARKGDANFSDVQWWLEWYTDTGGTAATVTVSVVYNDGSTGNLTGFSLGATRRASYMVPLNGLIPAAAAGKYIRAVTGVQLSASTAAAGNFGVTATRPRSVMPCPVAGFTTIFNWADLNLPSIENSACLFLIALCSTTSTGTVRGGAKIAHG